MNSRKSVGLGILAALLGGLQIHAQTAGEKAQRSKLMLEAQDARKKGDHQKALTLAGQAGHIQMTPSLRLFIAEEQNLVGQLANSFANAEHCATEATEDKALENREKILEGCNNLIAELKRTSARVIVVMPTPLPPGTEVTAGGHVVPESVYGRTYPLVPGNIDVDATAPGHVSFHKELTVGPGDEVTVTVLLPQTPEPALAQTPPVASPAVITPIAPAPEKSTLRRVGPYATLGFGAASLATSALFFILKNNAISKIEAQCTGPDHTICPDRPDIRSSRDTASTDNAIANISLVVGVAAVTGGAVWLYLEKTASRSEVSAGRLKILPSPGGALVAFGGTF